MPSSTPPRREVIINLTWLIRHKLLSLILAGILVAVVSVLVWLGHVTTRPEHVFKAMLASNFSTLSVTRSVDSSQADSSIQQVSQLSFQGEPRSRSVVVLNQKADGAPATEVKTETIGTPTTDFSRYVSIKTDQKGANGQKLDYSKAEGLWGQAKADDSQAGQYLNQAALGLVAFANLTSEKRSAMLAKVYAQNIYSTDFNKAKSKVIDGKAVWEYQVTVNVAQYVGILKELGTLNGIASLTKLDANSYAQSPPTTVAMSVTKRAHQLVKVSYPGGGQTETYGGYGLKQVIELPARVMPLSDLQQLVQAVQ